MLIRLISACAVAVWGYAGYWSARLAFADYLAASGSRSSLQHALRLAPGNPEYYVRLADASPDAGVSALQQAAKLNPLNSTIWIELAGIAEDRKDFRRAERSLLHAVELDKTFAPRWLLAEFYARRLDQPHFWPAMRAALATSYDDVTPLFDLCWNFAPNPETILQQALPDRPDVLRQYFAFLIGKNQLDAAPIVANRLMQHAEPADIPSMLTYCDRLLDKNNAPAALNIWNLLSTKRLLDRPALLPSSGMSLTNGRFEKPFLSQGFDWRLTAPGGVFVPNRAPSTPLRFDFSGKQPESCELLSQFLPVEPSRKYRLAAHYETEGLSGDIGLKWRVIDMITGADLLSGAGQIKPGERLENAGQYGFSTPPETRLLKLLLVYQRALGTVRIEGSLSLRSLDLGFDR